MERNPMEKKFAKSLFKYSLGRVSAEDAERMAPSSVEIFLEGCKTSQTLAHKGLDWYAKEIAKNM